MSATPLAAARLRVQLRLAALFLGGPALGLALLIGGPALAYAVPEPKGVLLAGGLLIAGYGLLLLGALFPRRPRPQEDDGLPVERTNEPALAALVDEVAARVGARLPREVRIVHGAGVACQIVRRGGVRRCRVEIGMPEIQALDRAGLEALLAFHLAHDADGDLRLRRAMAWALATLEPAASRKKGLFGDAFRHFRSGLLAAWETYEAAHVFAMDEIAARHAGAPVHRAALRRAAALPAVLERFLAEEVQPVLQENLLPADLWQGFRLCLRALEESGQLTAMERDAAETPAEEGRPTLAGRLAALRLLAAEAGPGRGGAAEPARALLCNAPAAERATAARWIGPAAGPTIGWEETAEKVWAARFRRAAAELRRALPPSTDLFQAIEWMAAPTQLALAAAAWPRILETELNREERERHARQLVQRGLAGWIGEELVARGWRWDTSPGHAVELVGAHAERISPLALLAPIGAEPGAVEALRDRLEALGLDRPAARIQAAPRNRALLH